MSGIRGFWVERGSSRDQRMDLTGSRGWLPLSLVYLVYELEQMIFSNECPLYEETRLIFAEGKTGKFASSLMTSASLDRLHGSDKMKIRACRGTLYAPRHLKQASFNLPPSIGSFYRDCSLFPAPCPGLALDPAKHGEMVIVIRSNQSLPR